MDVLSRRAESDIPGAVSRYGYSSYKVPTIPKIYDDRTIPAILHANGLPYGSEAVREFLDLNRIGNISELRVGMEIRLPIFDNFKSHPESN
jgi:hypothetical protein